MSLPAAMRQPDSLRDVAASVRRRLVGANLAFGAMPDLIHRTHRLACNAEVACARAGAQAAGLEAVTRELGAMSGELDEVLGDLAHLFNTAAEDVAHWVEGERRFRVFLAVQAELRNEPSLLEGGLDPDSLRRFQAQAKGAQGNEALLWRRLFKAREEVLSRIESLARFASHLRRTLDHIDLVAVRKSRFIGVMAQIEAARTYSDGIDFAPVSSSIRGLADEIADTAERARDDVSGLSDELKTVIAPLRGALELVNK